MYVCMFVCVYIYIILMKYNNATFIILYSEFDIFPDMNSTVWYVTVNKHTASYSDVTYLSLSPIFEVKRENAVCRLTKC